MKYLMKKHVMQDRIGVLARNIGMSDDPDEILSFEPEDVADAAIAADRGDLLRRFLGKYNLGYDAVERRFHALNYGGLQWLKWQILRKERSTERIGDLGLWE